MNLPVFLLKRLGLATLFLVLIVALGYLPAQNEFSQIALFYFPAFLLYLWLSMNAGDEQEVRIMLGIGVLARLLIFPAFPQLSDDIYRFVWDGRLIVNGINPFEQLPAYYMQAGNEVRGLNQELFNQLNSPKYFTIYPPVAQGVFALAAYTFRESINHGALLIKAFLLLCEIGTILLLPSLLRKLQLPVKNALFYALNPLVIIEVVGNLHFEGAMVFFLLLAFWWILNGRLFLSAIAMALSIAAKLLPLLFLFFFIRRLEIKRALLYFFAIGMIVLLLFTPLLGEAFFSGFGSSLDLYFRRFEFNGSIYYLVRWLGYQTVGYNLIKYAGPILAMGTFVGIGLAALLDRKNDWPSIFALCLFAICLYLAFTTTIHPWYSILPLTLCIFTRFRFPILWTGLIMLTYINYSYSPYWENGWGVLLEYSLVYGAAVYEIASGNNCFSYPFKEHFLSRK